jgi:hypothetical protein
MKTKTNETMKGLSTKELLKLRKSKIENKKRHIQNLVQKRERLNLEIKGAIKSLKRELKTMKKPFRESLELPEDATTQESLAAGPPDFKLQIPNRKVGSKPN